MNEKEETQQHRSWLERLIHALHGEPHNRDELLEVLRDAREREILDSEALGMIEGVMRVTQMQVRDVMLPRAQMVVIEHDAKLNELLPIIIDSAHSRFPVIGESRDEVLGLLLAKDLLSYALEKPQNEFAIQNLIRPAVFIPESKRLNVLLKEFRLNRNHMAIVVDEYGGIAGLITIEDVLEQIVGDIEDETDKDEEEGNIKLLDNGEHAVKALTSIEEFNDFFKTNISDEAFDTVGGYITQQFGHMPKRGESVKLDGLEITVLLGSKRRLQLLSVKKPLHAKK